MDVLKLTAYIMILLFSISIITFSSVCAQNNQFVNYLIKPDGTIEPDNLAIIKIDNKYILTQDISGTVTIQKDDAVFDGAGFTLMGNAVKGAYNLSDSVLYLEAGFNLTRAWNVTIQNVRIENCVNGVSLVNAYYCRVQNCTIVENAVDGIKVAYSGNNSIVWNEFNSNSDDAIQLVNAQNNNIMVNNLNSGVAYRSNGNGFQLNGNCSNNLIEGNIVASFDTGIFFDASTGNVSGNIVSYNNFTGNKWNGAYITGIANNITLNNFYNNGLLLEGDSNCSGNYWSINPSVFDMSPRDNPVNTDITAVFIELPKTEPTPTNTPNPTDSAATPTTKPTKTTSPTATPKETSQPTPLSTLTPTATPEPTQPPINLSILIVITAILSASALVFVPLMHRGKVKGSKNKCCSTFSIPLSRKKLFS